MLIKYAYRDNKELRDSFNELAEKVFGLNFEGWYQNGFWKEAYDPYSVIEDGKVVSNISVNRCDMNYKGKIFHLIQLGTVMTDPDYRGKGYAQDAIRAVEDIYGKDHWCLDTILQEKGNLHLYEKMGYHQTGKIEHINDRMDIVFYEKD